MRLVYKGHKLCAKTHCAFPAFVFSWGEMVTGGVTSEALSEEELLPAGASREGGSRHALAPMELRVMTLLKDHVPKVQEKITDKV